MGSVVFFDAKMFVVRYCMVVAFHPELDIPRICVFRSYDQSADQQTSLSLTSRHYSVIFLQIQINTTG